MDMWPRIKSDFPTALLYALATLFVTTASNAVANAFGWLTTAPKHGVAPLMTPITVPAWALLASLTVFVLWLIVSAFVRRRASQADIPGQRNGEITAAASNNQQSGWCRYEIPAATSKPGDTMLAVSEDEPGFSFTLTIGGFREVQLGSIAARMDYLGVYRHTDGRLAAEMKIVATLPVIGDLRIVAGGESNQISTHVFRVTQTNDSKYFDITHVFGYYRIIAINVDHINPQTGEIRVNGLIATKPMKPISFPSISHAKPDPGPYGQLLSQLINKPDNTE